MTQNHNNRYQKGFTLVELMIAMAFISLLLLAIAMTVLRIGGIYDKGITMKSVNQVGRSVVDDMRRTISAGKPFAIDVDHYNEAAGRLCTGTYSYVWNKGSGGTNVYEGVAHSATPIGLVRVRDTSAKLCADGASADVNYDNATELLSDNRLAVQLFSITEMTHEVSTGGKLYGISMVLSDADQSSVYVNTIDTTSCKPPNDVNASSNFCAVNQFDFTALAGGNGGGQ